MKKILFGLVAIIAMGLSSSIVAQGPKRGGTPEEMAKMQTNHMKEYLELSEDQVSEVGAINLKYAKKRDEMREEADGDREAMYESMKKMFDERKAEMKEILTEEQYKTYLAKEEEMRKKRGRKGQGKRGPEGF